MKQVLVADGSHVIRRLAEVSLEQVRLRVESASTGAEARDALVEVVPDVLIVDLRLPDMSGWDVVSFARSEPELDGVAIIMMIGNGDAEVTNMAQDDRVDAYLLKPYRSAELRRVVLDTIHGMTSAPV